MRNHPALLDGSFASAYLFQDRQFFVHPLEGLDIDHVGGRAPMLGDQDWVSVPGDCGNNVRRLAL